MKNLVVHILLLHLLQFTVSEKDSSTRSCHEIPERNEALEYLASKRPYHFDNPSSYTYTPEGCSAVQLWYFGRHGTRYPGEEDIMAMNKLLPGLHHEIIGKQNESNLCSNTFKYFSTWKPRPDVVLENDSVLHAQGVGEIESISSRFIARYPKLFPPDFANSTYYFKFTKSQRTNASAHAFVHPIFNDVDHVWFPPALSNDPVLKFYSVCPKWEQEVDKNPGANLEHDRFVSSIHMNGTIQRVSSRLGLGRNLSLEEITTIYTTCAFETAWGNGTLSQWCGLFALEDLSVMEYREDLEYYWKDGYGFRINFEQACVPFHDAIMFFDEYPGEQEHTILDYRRMQAYFSHSGATLKMFARLGLFNDTIAPRADNYDQVKDTYQWKTSRIDSMGTNMALVLFSCNGTDLEHRKQIGLFVNEVPTPFPGCGGQPFCPYEEFRGSLEQFTGNCDLETICS